MTTHHTSKNHRVVIIGASDQPDRYSYKAMKALERAGCDLVLIHPKLATIENHHVLHDLSQIQGKIHTVTLYVRPEISRSMTEALIGLRPERVIFNPGTENPRLEDHLQKEGIKTLRACTLVMLATDSFLEEK